MTLKKLLTLLDKPHVTGNTSNVVESITDDSRKAGEGILFAAVKGEVADGNQYIPNAIEAGCKVILTDKVASKKLSSEITWIQVKDSRKAMAVLASSLAGSPSSHMKLCGVTGTNGKTTNAYLVQHIMKTAWHRAGMLGTVSIDDGESIETAHGTTPGSIELQSILKRMQDHDCRGVAMEVSSHGIDQDRIYATAFDACIFTNLTQDHLDYHGTMEKYFAAKKQWFLNLAKNPFGKKPVAIINTDDAYGAELADLLDGKIKTATFGFNVHADYRMNTLKQSPRGMEFQLTVKGKSFLVRAPLIGRFNAYNVTSAIAGAVACGIPLREAVAAIANAPQVPGRMENVGSAGGATVFVDYAHTPDALENACRTLKELEPGRLITIFGCGGDRDKKKRPLMAKAAAANSHFCVVTSDNPRSENPETIIAEIVKGIRTKNFTTIVDRAEAIAKTIEATKAADIVLIAGKGHENYQIFADETIDFDDKKHAQKALRTRTVESAKFREELSKNRDAKRTERNQRFAKDGDSERKTRTPRNQDNRF